MNSHPLQKHILLVGSSTQEEAIYREALRQFELHFVSDFDAAIKKIKNGIYHLVLVHYELPSRNGLELIREIKSISRNQIPAIIVMNAGCEKIAVQAMKMGVSDCITRDEFLSAIITMSVTRAIEHKKWEQIYLNFIQGDQGTILKDPITDLFNKGYFETRMKEEMVRSKRYEFPLTMMILQVEQFSFIQEKYGEEASHGILKKLGQIISGNIRTSDLLARIKDDTFSILLPHTSLEQARFAWERITGEASMQPFPLGEENFFLSLKGALIPLNKEIEALDILIRQVEEWIQDKEVNFGSLHLFLPDNN